MSYFIRIDYLNGWDPKGAVRQFIEVGGDGIALRAVEEYENGKYGWATRTENSVAILPEYCFPKEDEFSESRYSSEGEYRTQKISKDEFDDLYFKATKTEAAK